MNDLDDRLGRIGRMVESLDAVGGDARSTARALVSAVLDLHREGLQRLFAQASENPRARAVLLGDALVCSLLVLHDLHPDPLEERVRRAIEDAAARLGSGAEVELVELADWRARMRIEPDRSRGQSFTSARRVVEESLCRFAPDVVEVVVTDRAGGLPLPVSAGERRS